MDASYTKKEFIDLTGLTEYHSNLKEKIIKPIDAEIQGLNKLIDTNELEIEKLNSTVNSLTALTQEELQVIIDNYVE